MLWMGLQASWIMSRQMEPSGYTAWGKIQVAHMNAVLARHEHEEDIHEMSAVLARHKHVERMYACESTLLLVREFTCLLHDAQALMEPSEHTAGQSSKEC